jgi:hypothetical protein
VLCSRETLQGTGKTVNPMDWTLLGKHTDLSSVNQNASDSILRNNESDSIKSDERDLQQLKQEEPRISTVRGITIEVREERENALDRIARTKRSAPIQIITRRR